MSDIVPYKDSAIASYDDIEKAAKAMAGSGFFQDVRQASQAVVKIMAGRELGVGPFASMTGVNIIKGRPALSANIMAACVKKSGRYNYRVTEMTDHNCVIEFMERMDGKWATSGVSGFSLDDARKAGTDNLDKFPRNMLFARAMSNGVRWFCPDVMNGSAVYTPEELGADVDQEGEVISVPVAPVVEVVEAKPARPRVTYENGNRLLGLEDASEPVVAVVEKTDEPMTIERAAKIQSESAGKSYGEMTLAELTTRFNALGKSLKDNNLSPEEHAEKQMKQQACKVLIDGKRDGSIR